jgi:hypothetical protein
MTIRRGFHRLYAVLAGLWLAGTLSFPGYLCFESYREHARLAASPLWGPGHVLTQRAALDVDAFCSAGSLLDFLSDLEILAFVLGPPMALYALGWMLIAPSAWVLRGFNRTKASDSRT